MAKSRSATPAAEVRRVFQKLYPMRPANDLLAFYGWLHGRCPTAGTCRRLGAWSNA